MKLLGWLLFFVLLAGPPVRAGAQSPADNTSAATASQAPITEYSPPPAAYARAKEYSRAQHRQFFFDALYGVLVLLVLLRWRVAPTLRNLAERVSARRSVQLLIYSPLVLLAIAVPGIATDIGDHKLQRDFGLSVEAWGPWFRDWMLNLALMLIVGTLLIAVLYAVVRRSPRRWWFYFWMASLPILLAMFFLQPLIIDPFFYTFKPLAETQPVLLAEMQKVVERGGMDIPPSACS